MDTVANIFIEIKYTPGTEESTAYHIVTCGALQGFIFRTLFFLIFVNSIHKVFDCINYYKILRDYQNYFVFLIKLKLCKYSMI